MSTTTVAWAPITKVEDQPDGTVMVYGPAADAGVDRDKQRLNQTWLDKALPEWFAAGANVREQHDPLRAVGRGVGLTREDDGAHMLVAHVVDPVAVTKVKTGVLQGFSIRIKEPRVDFGKADAPNGEIVGGTIPEVSLVDRPSRARTYFTVVKAEGDGELTPVEGSEVVEVEQDDDPPMFGDDLAKFVSAAARQRMAGTGVAMPNGDFPIPDEGHLTSAVGHLGNYTGDKTAAKAHIISRARTLGLTDRLPQEWGVPSADTMAKAEQILAEVATLLPDLTKAEDEAGDIATAQQAIALIGKLITSEATSLAGGQLDEEGDIRCLLDAVCALKYFISCEEQEMEPNPTAGDSDMADDTVKAETTGAPMVAQPVVDPDILKAAVAEAMNPVIDELALVKADLAKALAMPVLGGPVAMRTTSQSQQARNADADLMRRQAAAYKAKANSLSQEDPVAARGYRDMAADLLVKADV